jgi:CubicO group peptidase (beta-lactamase class C family)
VKNQIHNKGGGDTMGGEMRIDPGPIDLALRERVEALAIPGVVAMAATGSELIYQSAFGRRDLSKPEPMTPDSVFWIASMTKAVTAVAAMQLVEQGKLTLDAPIGTVLSELADPKVLEGFNADGAPRLRPAKSPITLRHLLTHTSGFCYDMWNAELLRYRDFAKLPSARSGKYAGILTPIMTDPGTRWEYGTSLDFAGRAVEAASGQTLEAYLRDHIFAPLGMEDTAFKIGPAQRQRLVSVHSRQPDGALSPIAFEIEQDPEYHAGGGGLYGTAPDYLKFMQMILNRGQGNGHQLLKPETVALMGENHIGELEVTKMNSAIAFATNDLELFPGIDKKWGLSFLINLQPTPEGRSPGSLAWAGLANTYYWIDPTRDLCGVILMQVLPFADPQCLEAFAAFERGVYQALDANQRAA